MTKQEIIKRKNVLQYKLTNNVEEHLQMLDEFIDLTLKIDSINKEED
tara:strand:- start:1336 stop:1476 length:141 start_codon:yes stop_codon:yes gene_type:complete